MGKPCFPDGIVVSPGMKKKSRYQNDYYEKTDAT